MIIGEGLCAKEIAGHSYKRQQWQEEMKGLR